MVEGKRLVSAFSMDDPDFISCFVDLMDVSWMTDVDHR